MAKCVGAHPPVVRRSLIHHICIILLQLVVVLHSTSTFHALHENHCGTNSTFPTSCQKRRKHASIESLPTAAACA